ncbi:MAG: F0F1 ATP synthase subunit gamma [Propionibacteriales bacterium]|nr:F0F1 ATP synthase subunit gamma [Propionibacteriales bacterium]
MAATLRELRARIKSVQATKQITRAMELIAASRIVKAQQRARAAAPYARELTRAVTAVATYSNVNHALTTEPEESKRAAVLVVTSDRGLAGAYSSSVLREAEQLREKLSQEGKEVDTYVSGRKGVGFYAFRQRPLVDSWVGFSDTPTYNNAVEMARALIEAFTAEEGETRPEAHEVLPLYEFEPSAGDVLDALLPRYVESRIFFCLLQASASELAARQRAMKSATDNAEELINKYIRTANKARQAGITQEISEIVGGANALADATAGSE